MMNQYKILDNLTNGEYSSIYKVSYNNSLYVIKKDSNIDLLKHEASIYTDFRNINFISKLYDFFIKDSFAYMVIDFFDENLYIYKHKNLNNINYEINIIDIFDILFNTLQHIHNLGYVHRDLKPLNICLKNTVPYLIDFGFSKKIIENKKHIPEKNTRSIIGSYSFISNNVNKLIEPTRRDDIESMLYILLFMFIYKDNEKNFVGFNIQNEKIDDLTIKLDKFKLESYKKILIYTKKMKFSQEPNYYYIINELFNK